VQRFHMRLDKCESRPYIGDITFAFANIRRIERWLQPLMSRP
jgi:hypothetical protein